MTDMIFKCLECHKESRVLPTLGMNPVGNIFNCPKCNTEYKIIEIIQPHIIHTVPILKHIKTGNITTFHPIAFVINIHNLPEVERYFDVLKSL